jgi:hypothetical protein
MRQAIDAAHARGVPLYCLLARAIHELSEVNTAKILLRCPADLR